MLTSSCNTLYTCLHVCDASSGSALSKIDISNSDGRFLSEPNKITFFAFFTRSRRLFTLDHCEDFFQSLLKIFVFRAGVEFAHKRASWLHCINSEDQCGITQILELAKFSIRTVLQARIFGTSDLAAWPQVSTILLSVLTILAA